MLQDNLNPVYYSALLDSIKAIYDVFSVDDDELEKEIAELCSTKTMDLTELKTPLEGECINLAKQFVEIMQNPLTPQSLKNSIQDALAENNQSMDAYFDKGYVASILCRNQD